MRHLALALCLPLTAYCLACTDDGPAEPSDETATGDTDDSSSTTDDEVGTDDGTSSSSTTTDGTEDTTTTDDGTDDTTTTDDGTDTDDTSDTTGNDEVLRFIAMGDGGEGNESQYAVAAAVEQVCADKGGCEFVLYLGDNFYDNGVDSAMDTQFQTKFEEPYADLDMPFHIVLGNHDYGELSFLWEKSAYEIEYTNYSDKWELPSEWYSLSYPNLDLFIFDTTRFMWNHQTGAQQDDMDQWIAASNAPWKIAMGHHPYLSNGQHGNAGNYEGFPFPPQLAGTTVKEVLDDSVCGKVDLYLCGHDHNRQWHQDTCGPNNSPTHFIVTGAAAKTTDFAYHSGGNDVYWENDVTPGFLLLEIEGNTLHTEFYDENGTFEFERDIVK